MKKASISEAKNNLSRLLKDVAQGERILICDRRRPVAILAPYRSHELADLVSDGIVSPPKAKLDVEAFLATTGPKLPAGVSAAEAVVAERDEGR